MQRFEPSGQQADLDKEAEIQNDDQNRAAGTAERG